MLAEILEGLINAFGPIVTISGERRELKDQALRSISTALTETYLYYSKLERGEMRSREAEAILSHYWAAVAIPMRHFDRQLADRCQHKSEYWINPERYTNSQIKALGIQLKSVKQAYQQMLRPWSLREAILPSRAAKKATTKGAQKPVKKAAKKATRKPKN